MSSSPTKSAVISPAGGALRVLILSQHFWPETFRINEVARNLAAAVLEVRVLTGKPNYPDGVIFEGYRLQGVDEEMFGGVRVHRVPLVPRGAAEARDWRRTTFPSCPPRACSVRRRRTCGPRA